MMNRYSRSSNNSDLWPFALLVVVVMIPTIGILWFVSIALRNEQLANRQRLADAYRSHLTVLSGDLESYWSDLTDRLQQQAAKEDPRHRFGAAIRTGLVDSAVCLGAAGDVLYPMSLRPAVTDFDNDAWSEAEKLEYEYDEPNEALAIYQKLTEGSASDLEQALGVQAQARCLFKLNQPEEAIALVADRFGGPLSGLHDAQGRLIAANVELMAIELGAGAAGQDQLVDRLFDRLDYRSSDVIPHPQQLFLMNRLSELLPGRVSEIERDAENIAGKYFAAHPKPSRNRRLQPTQISGLWQIATSDESMLLLLTTERLTKMSAEAIGRADLPNGLEATVIPPGNALPGEGEIAGRAGDVLPGWQVTLTQRDGSSLVDDQSTRSLYLWITVLVVLFTVTLAIFVVISLRRRIRVANLKNDLVGTVSHELKTPLSSMRLLVDTLLDSERLDPDQTREYLQLIDKENSRLSSLIENFLTFSRLEQGRHVYEFRPSQPGQLVQRAVDSAGERFQQSDCQLDVEIEPELPLINADEDGVVMAVLNFLDNAYKYSTPPRKIVARAFADGSEVCLAVSDNGIGLSRSQAKRVFHKFYQVDQSLVRTGQGCGLGLSIVSNIAAAHQGKVTVDSRVGEGSTFTLRFPALGKAERVALEGSRYLPKDSKSD